jgi:hypothetical protein
MAENFANQNLAEIYIALGRPAEALPAAQRSFELYKQLNGATSGNAQGAETRIARALCYQGDLEPAAATISRILAAQAEARKNGDTAALLLDDSRLVLEALDLSLKGAAGADFDALVSHARQLGLQPQDVIEIMEWKAIGARRAGRDTEALAGFEAALAEADRVAPIASDRLRRQIASAAAVATSSRLAGSA